MVRSDFNFTSVLLIVAIFYSCENKDALKKEQEKRSMDHIVNDYIDMFLSEGFLKREYLLRVEKEASFNEYNVYGITMTPYLLELDDLPNKINQYRDVKIAFFTEAITEDSIKDSLRNELIKNDLYRKDSLIYRFHYPEWLIIENKLDNQFDIFKDSKSVEE